MVECGWGATRVKDGYLKRKYESLVARRGKKKALIAVGHKIIVAAYHILNKNETYQEPVLKVKSERTKKKSVRNYITKMQELGISREELIQLFDSQTTKNKDPFFTET